MRHVIGQLGRHTITTHPAPDIQPGHQMISITPADFDGICILRALTGATQDKMMLRRLPLQGGCPDGPAWSVPHDEAADQRLMDLVDLCAGLRYSAPQLVQLQIEGWVFDGHERA